MAGGLNNALSRHETTRWPQQARKGLKGKKAKRY